MADVILSITIPDAKVALAKAVADEMARRDRLIEPTATLTNAQAKSYLEGQCRQFLVSLVARVNGARESNLAIENAQAEAQSLFP